MKALGIDIGGTSTKLAVIETSSSNGSGDEAHLAWTAQSALYTKPDAKELVAAVHEAIRDHSLTCDRAGICVPGLLDRERRVVTLSVNVPGLMNVPLDEIVRRALGCEVPRVKILNDAVATATDVIITKKLTGRVLSLALGTGVGMGVLDDGVALLVEGSSPGHIGQVDVSIAGDDCIGPDGGRGSLEGYLGVPALIRRYGSTEEFLARASVNETPIRALVRAIRICHAIYRPAHVVIVGGIGTRLKKLSGDIKAACDDHLTSVARDDWKLHFGDHDFHAAIGAARLAAAV